MRNWFEKNCDQKEGFWLIYYKKSSGIGYLKYTIIVDILLCYGWIGSLGGKIDENQTKLYVAPRNPKSNWSRVNKDKVKLLNSKVLIHPNGHKMINLAKISGAWDALNDVENLEFRLSYKKLLIKILKHLRIGKSLRGLREEEY